MRSAYGIALAGLMCSAALNAALAADAVPEAMTKYFAWSGNGYDYEPPLDGLPAAVTHDPHYPYCPNGTPGCTVQPRMGDEHSPILQPWAQSVVIQWNRDILKGKQAFVGQSRCWPTNTPTVMLLAGGRWQFPVSKDEYMMIYERGPAVRHIYLNQQHDPRALPTWLGDQVGHYEGGSLVVDTTQIIVHPYSQMDMYRTPHSAELHTIERYTVAPDGSKMVAALTVDDPGAFTTKWSASKTYRPNPTPISEMEYICAENNDANYLGEDEVPVPQTLIPDF